MALRKNVAFHEVALQFRTIRTRITSDHYFRFE